jgi:hypothetical protein
MYFEDGSEEHLHLEPNGIYSVDRSIEHDSVNNGETERIHLLMEVNDR